MFLALPVDKRSTTTTDSCLKIFWKWIKGIFVLFLKRCCFQETQRGNTSVWGDVRFITVIWWWWWNKANQQTRAASLLRLWESLIHPQHSSMKTVSFYGLSDQKKTSWNPTLWQTQNDYDNKCLETASPSRWRCCLIIYFIYRGASNFILTGQKWAPALRLYCWGAKVH